MSKIFTTCITNFSRIERLKECLASLDLTQPLTVASYGATDAHTQVLSSLPYRTPTFATSRDLGCNRMWMQAIALARTKYVSILHDDDRRPIGFASAVHQIMDKMEKEGAGFACWNGRQLDVATGRLGGTILCGMGRNGTFDSDLLMPAFRTPNGLPFSPVAYLFQRDTCLDVLSWCEDHLADCTTKPRMMVGNDLALSIGHAQRFPKFVQSVNLLSHYGHWDGSETIAWSQGRNPKLVDCYNTTRSRLFDSPVVFPRRRHRMIVHVSLRSQGAPGRRQQLAERTWASAYEQAHEDYLIVPLYLIDTDLPRNSGSLGDPRKLAFIKDAVEVARRLCDEDDVIVLSNADICVVPECFRTLAAHTTQYGAAATHRRDFYAPFHEPMYAETIREKGNWHAGGDLFSFTGRWWDQVGRINFPDMVIACEAWDWIFRWIVHFSTGRHGFKNLTYHEYHGGWWELPENRFKNPAQLHNRRLARAWMLTHGAYRGEFDGKNLPVELNVEPQGEDD